VLCIQPRALAAFVCFIFLGAATAHAEISLVGVGSIPGTARDQSGLSNLLEDGLTPGDLVGGLGSALAYSGSRNIYYATPDRGPADGATTYKDRLYTLEIDVTRTAPNAYKIEPRVIHTRLLRTKEGVLTGSAAAFDSINSPEGLRFDPEGLRISACGDSVYVSDEYGPFVYEFRIASGKRVRSLGVPNKFLIDLPSASANDELTKNVAGRQSNRGMEGLAISPDGAKLYGIMQSALLQDGALNAANSRIGLNNRIVEIDVETGAVREFVYQLDNDANGVSEIVAINNREFLVLERDGRAGAAAVFKKVFKIDIGAATDVRAIKTLPTSDLPAGVVAVTKQLFLDMLDPKFGLAGPAFPEKLEALAFGPDLDDGRLLLFVVNDNDFLQTQNTNFYAFAIDRSDLPGYTPQEVQRGRSCARRDDED
jgi:hypothetical protein